MSSSDSEEDCYGNLAQKLQFMKNKYEGDKIETKNLLESSIVNTEAVTSSTAEALNESLETADDSILDKLIEEHSTKRVTRTRGKKKTVDKNVSGSESKSSSKRGQTAKTRGKGRGRGRKSTSVPHETSISSPSPRPASRRRPGRYALSLSHHIPTYSVGNTEDYPDQSDNQALFSSRASPEVVILDDDPLDENEMLSVKVYWQSSEFFKFSIRKFQKIVQIFDYFSKKENVEHNQLLFTFNEKILKPDDTPDSISYSIAKFIDGGIVNQNVSKLVTNKGEVVRNGINIKFQCQNVKKPFNVTVRPDDKFLVAMMKFAEHLEKPLDKLKFSFDGDIITGKNSARDMDLEGGECIDVNILS